MSSRGGLYLVQSVFLSATAYVPERDKAVCITHFYRPLQNHGSIAKNNIIVMTYRVLVGRLEGKRPLGRPRRRREGNIKVYLQEVGWEAWTGFEELRIRTDGELL